MKNVNLSAVNLLSAPILAGVLAFLTPAAFAQETAPVLDMTRTVDWAAGRVVMEVRRALDLSTPSLVKAKADAETEMDQRMPEILSRALGPLTVDSSHALSDYFSSDPAMAAKLNDAALRAQRTDLFLSQDFSTLVARYVIPFFGEQGIAAPFFPSQATPVRRRLGDVATRPYTGLLIFAQGKLAAAGSSREAQARPALFPRIWDEQMNLVLDRSMCTPASLARWGMVGYSQSVDDPAADLRVGAVPLRLAARGVFGDKDTDIVISTEGARQLLAIPQNIALLQQGRIVIVYDKLE
jgi:hypothetical protein